MKAFPTKRVRFVTYRGMTPPQREMLAGASTVSFVPMEMVGDRGHVLGYGERAIEEVATGYSRFFEGDVVIAKITPCFENCKGAVVHGMPFGVGFGTTELHVLTPHESMDARFLCYVTAGPEFRLKGAAFMVGAAGQKRVTEDFVRDFACPVPPLDTQRAIADHLDRETARIDALVAAKERVLELMAEKRRALISRAVTRGLDPKAPVRDSGVPWLGEVPQHWGTERSRWLFRERDERSATGEEELLTVSHLTGVTPRSEKNVSMFEAETTEGYKICRKGDLVINTLWAWMGAMGSAPQDGIASPAYNVYTPSAALDPAYVDALVRMPVFAQEVSRYSKGVWSSRLRLYPEGFFEVWLPVPPIEEQRAIVAHIVKEAAKLDALRVATDKTILLLKERRGALISAAVTGALQVAEFV